MSWKIATTQLQDIQGGIQATLKIITKQMRKADRQSIDVLCFPECFLQGYTLNNQLTQERALALESTQFQGVLTSLASYKVAIILGMIEEENSQYFNTAVVIKNGEVVGKYRKVHLFEENFQPGEVYPVFVVNGLKFGINICYDARFSEGVLEMAAKGAEVIFYPLNNRLATEKAIKYRDKHMPNLFDRAKESGCIVVSSDVIHQDDTTIGFGCSAIVSPSGTMIGQVAELQEGLLVYEVARIPPKSNI